MKFLALGDIENADYLKDLSALSLGDYAFLVLTGDMSGSPEGWKIGRARALDDENFIPAEKEPKEYYRELLRPSVEKLRKVESNLQEIRDQIKIFAVYGNTDFKSVVEKVQPTSFEVLHNRITEAGGLFLLGYNGHPMYPWEVENPHKKDIFGYTYGETAREINSFREDEIYRDLKSLSKDYPADKTIVVTHTPPYKILDEVKPELVDWAIKSYGEKAKNGNVGSTGLKNFIKDSKPLLSIFGHIHESKGIDKFENTTVINTGGFGENKEVVEVSVEPGRVKAKFMELGEK